MSDMYFKSLPDKSTPLTPSNLDKLNDIKISPTEPTTNEKVWIQKGKNIHRGGIKQGLYLLETGNYGTNNMYVCSNNFIQVMPNKTITISNQLNKIGKWYVLEYDTNMQLITVSNSTDYTISYTVTLQNNTKYILIDLGYGEEPCTPENTGDFQVEYNSIATEYEEYIEKKIYCKNDNGIYEEFVNVEENKPINITTGVEFETGRIIDGKKEYGKRINCGNLPDGGGTKSVAHGLTNCSITKIEAYAKSTSYNMYVPIPFLETGSNSAYNVLMRIDENDIVFNSDNSQTHLAPVVTIYYTKN